MRNLFIAAMVLISSSAYACEEAVIADVTGFESWITDARLIENYIDDESASYLEENGYWG